MQVRPDQLASVLKKKINAVYFISGDEPLQKMEAADLVRTVCKQQEYLEREIIDVDAKFDWQILRDEAASMSLFSSRRILDLRLPSAKPGREGGKALKEFAENPPEDTVLLITAGKLEGSAKNSAWYKSLDSAGVVVQCWPVSPEKLSEWVKGRCLLKGLQPDKEAVEFICQHVEGNLLAADQEIDKLLLILGPGAVSYEAIKESVTQNSRFNVFELVDCALKGDKTRVVKVINGLKAEGTEPIIVAWAITKEVRLLCQAVNDRSNAAYMLGRSGVWQNRVALYTSCLSRHTKQSLYGLLQSCETIDRITKGVKKGNVWDALLISACQLTRSKK